MRSQIVIVAQPSEELELALDALEDLRGHVRLFSRPSEAAATLLAPSDPDGMSPIRVILIEVGDPSPGVTNLIAGLRRAPATARTPIVLWGPAEALQGLDLEHEVRANSYVPTLSDPRANATALAGAIHYWAVVNRPPGAPLDSRHIGPRR